MRRDVYQAIADPTRRDIINLIAYRPMNLNSIADNFRMSRPAVSQHIKILAECGLVHIRQEGRERFCEATLKPLGEVSDWIERYRRHWAEQYDALDDVLLRLQKEETAPDDTGMAKNVAIVPPPPGTKKTPMSVPDDTTGKNTKDGKHAKRKKHGKTDAKDPMLVASATGPGRNKGKKHKDNASKPGRKEKKTKAGRAGKK